MKEARRTHGVSACFFQDPDGRPGFDFALRGILWYFHTINQVFINIPIAEHNGCVYPE